MAHQPIVPDGLAPPPAPLSAGVLADNILYVSGMLSLDKSWALVGAGDIRAQTRQVLENIKAVVETAGGTMADVVSNSIFLRDLGNYAAMNAVYAEYFPTHPPARYCVRADLVPPACLVEIAAIAHIPRQARA